MIARTLFIKCIHVHMAALGYVKSAERGAYAHAAKKTTFFKQKVVISVTMCTECVRVGCNVMSVCLACHC